MSSPIVISHLFEGVRIINTVSTGNATLNSKDLNKLKDTYKIFMFDILGIKSEKSNIDSSSTEAYKQAINVLLDVRKDAKAKKDWATSDFIRNKLTEIGFEIKDTKDGFEWKLNK